MIEMIEIQWSSFIYQNIVNANTNTYVNIKAWNCTKMYNQIQFVYLYSSSNHSTLHFAKE